MYANLRTRAPRNTDEQNPNVLETSNNDDPGTIRDIYRSVAASLGKHTSSSRATVRFPGSGPTTFGDGKQGQGDYQLTYTIRRG